MTNNFLKIEAEFEVLIQKLREIFDEREISEVKHFMDVGEYGLALDVVVDVTENKPVKLNSCVLRLISDLACAMGISEGDLWRGAGSSR